MLMLLVLLMLPLVRVLPRSVMRRTWIATAMLRVSPHGSAAAAAAAVRRGRTWAPLPAAVRWGPIAVVPAPLGAAIVRPPVPGWSMGAWVDYG